MYRLVVRWIVRQTYRRLNQEEYDKVVPQFAPSARFLFAGDHVLGGERRGREQVRAWFRQVFELFPDLRLEPDQILVGGWPWNTWVSVHFRVRATLRDGTPYQNEGMQLLRLRWGRAVEDCLFEDTQRLAAALEVQGTQRLSDTPRSHAAPQ
jgi:ketosteroid isomerase-like protein